jgi:hypothetical protein
MGVFRIECNGSIIIDECRLPLSQSIVGIAALVMSLCVIAPALDQGAVEMNRLLHVPALQGDRGDSIHRLPMVRLRREDHPISVRRLRQPTFPLQRSCP